MQGCGACACVEGNVPPLAEELARLTALLRPLREESSPPAIEEAQRWTHTVKVRSRAQTFWQWESFFLNSHQSYHRNIGHHGGLRTLNQCASPFPSSPHTAHIAHIARGHLSHSSASNCRSNFHGSYCSGNRHSCPVLSFHPSPGYLGDQGSSPDGSTHRLMPAGYSWAQPKIILKLNLDNILK